MQAEHQPKAEIRAFWADGFADDLKSPQGIDQLLRRLRAANCNAIFAQVRKSGDAIYLSRYEPWAHDDLQRFDALAYLIDKAHNGRPRIQVHAWINTCAVGRSWDSPFHIAKARPDFLSLSDTGENYDGEATKIDPGNPDAADWTFRVYMDVVRHYDVDGIHFDFVRYGSTDGKGRFGYNAASVARFNARYGRTGQPAWEDPLWKQWRRDQVTALVRKVYAMAKAIKPSVVVSAATITWGDGPHAGEGLTARQWWDQKSAPMNRVFQDWRSWMDEGILDLNCQMSYYQEAKHPDWFRRWIDWGKDNQYHRRVVPSSGIWLNPIADSLMQIAAIRSPSKHGHVPAGVLLYSYSGTNTGPDGKEQTYNEDLYNSLSKPSAYTKRPPFAEQAAFPELPWIAHPKNGIIKGFVLKADTLEPVDGAKVTLRGKTRRTQLTDGTGFFAFVDVPTGDGRIRVEAKGFPAEEEVVHLPAGRRHKPMLISDSSGFFVGSRSSAIRYGEEGWFGVPRLPTATSVAFRNLLVVGGSDQFVDGVYLMDSHCARIIRARVSKPSALPFVPGDVVAVRGVTTLDDGEAIVGDASVRVVGMEAIGRGPEEIDFTPQRESGRELLPDSGTAWPAKTIIGRVTELRSDRFILDDGIPMEVMLNGRKDPGVESAEEPLPAPDLGSRVQVTGIVTVTKHADGSTLIRIRPRSKDEIVILERPAGQRLLAILVWAIAASTVGCATAIRLRRSRVGKADSSLRSE